MLDTQELALLPHQLQEVGMCRDLTPTIVNVLCQVGASLLGNGILLKLSHIINLEFYIATSVENFISTSHRGFLTKYLSTGQRGTCIVPKP